MIYSAAPDSFDAWRSDESSPYDLPLNTPKDRAWAAAEALTRYVNSRGYSETATHSSDPNGPLSRLPLPPDTVLITVGPRNPADFENLERDEEMPCPVPLRSNTHRAPAVQGRHARKLGHYRLTASPFAVDPPPNLPLIRGRDWKRSQGGNCGARDYSCKTDSVDRMDRWRKLM